MPAFRTSLWVPPEGKQTARPARAATLLNALRPSDFGLRNSFGFRLSDFGFTV